ncbi:MAG: recombinase family protein, partial [Clostridia bacterium]
RRALASGVQVLQHERSAVAMQTPPAKRVAAYCRVSTDMEQQESSLETQMKVFGDMISARVGWALAGIYVDDGITATNTTKRVQFKQMIADCEAGKIDFIVTKSISRFARNTSDCLNYIKKLKELGIFIYFDDIHLDTSGSSSEMIITILAAVAQEESRNLSENMKLGMRMRFKAGKPKWVNTYGFIKGEDGEYRIHGEQAKGVRRIFELYVSGYSMPQVSVLLEKERIPAMNGGKWWPKSLATVLHNEKYIGDVMMQKSYTVDHISHKKIKNDQTVVPSYYVKGHHEGIVDRVTFERAQTIMRLKDRHSGCVQYPYYATLVCPLCGAKMVGFRLPVCGHPSVWTCGGHISETCVKTTCPPYVVNTKYIDCAVQEAYKKLDKEALEALAAEQCKEAAKERVDAPEEDASVAAKANAAQAALRWKEKQPWLQKVEYLFLDELVEKITLSEWREAVITWRFGLTSRVPIKYDKVSEIPNVELEHTDEGYMANGVRVRSGGQVLSRLDKIKTSCVKTRESGERPKSVCTATTGTASSSYSLFHRNNAPNHDRREGTT